jgi:hypothetical protein
MVRAGRKRENKVLEGSDYHLLRCPDRDVDGYRTWQDGQKLKVSVHGKMSGIYTEALNNADSFSTIEE